MMWIVVIEWLSRIILALLLLLSIWSVSIILERRYFFKKLSLPFEQFKKFIREKNFQQLKIQAQQDLGPLGQIFTHLSIPDQTPQQADSMMGQIDREFSAAVHIERQKLESNLSVLATLGSTTPFIGLLGTILGIIVSFGELSKGSQGTQTVMYSLAEALVLTAAGLVVAIPAVIAFNHFNKKSRMVLSGAAALKDQYVAAILSKK